jgi:hypothetical protein
MKAVYVATVVVIAVRLVDLALDPSVRATLCLALRMGIALIRRLLPALGDAHDFIVIALLLVERTPGLGHATPTVMPTLLPRVIVVIVTVVPVAGRSRLHRRADWPHDAMFDVRRNHDGGAPLTAKIIIVVVSASLAHQRERQYKESK